MSDPLHVLALVTDAFGRSGGIAQYNRDFLTALAADGDARVTILPRLAAGSHPAPAPGVVQLPPRPGRIAYSVGAVRAAIGRRVDVVFCGHLFMAPLAMAIARLKRARLVVQVHGIDAWSAPGRLRRRALDRADLVLSVSRHTRAEVLTWSTIAPERVVVVPNTVRAIFAPGERQEARHSLGLDDRTMLLSVGRLDARERYKGQDRVIEALPGLIAAGRRVAYVVAGDGDDRGRLETLARSLGVADAVVFIGEVGEERLPALYRAADLFLLPSTGEGFGIVFLEAMASGTPALGLAVGGATDALADGALGTLTTAGGLASAIAGIIDAPAADPAALSASVAARFGHEAFLRAVARARTRMAGAA